MVTNVYAKSNYDRLRIHKALGFQKSDNNDNKNKKVQLTKGLRAVVIPRWPSAAILDFIEPEIAPFDPPTPKTLA